MGQYTISESEVIFFDCNGSISDDQIELFTIDYVLPSRVGDFQERLRVFKNKTHLSVFSYSQDDTGPQSPALSLPVQSADWLLKTRPRFGMPESRGGVPSNDSGFNYFIKGEDISLSVTPVTWDLVNASRPHSDDYESRWKQSLGFAFYVFDSEPFQQMLKKVASEHPIQPGDVVLFEPTDYDYDYVNVPIFQMGLFHHQNPPEGFRLVAEYVNHQRQLSDISPETG